MSAAIIDFLSAACTATPLRSVATAPLGEPAIAARRSSNTLGWDAPAGEVAASVKRPAPRAQSRPIKAAPRRFRPRSNWILIVPAGTPSRTAASSRVAFILRDGAVFEFMQFD